MWPSLIEPSGAEPAMGGCFLSRNYPDYLIPKNSSESWWAVGALARYSE
jgi:hypothetical protein